MPKRKQKSVSTSEVSVKLSNVSYEIDCTNDNHDQIVFLPNADDSGDSDQLESDLDDNAEADDFEAFDDTLPRISYQKSIENYREDQQKLEERHSYVWVNGEKVYDNDVQNEILLTDAQKTKIRNSQPVELFETFFSAAMKNYIVEATKANGYDLTLPELNTFIGIIILSSFNKRKSQRDY